ncbi:MAG: putative S-layer protein [archaeon]
MKSRETVKFINSNNSKITTIKGKMKTNLILVLAFSLLIAMPNVLGALSITASDITASHNSQISIPFTLTNAGALVTNLSINITSLKNSSQTTNVGITNEAKKSINASGSTSYSIDNYPIAQYTGAGSYSVIISVAGNESGTQVTATKTITITVNESKVLSPSATTLSVSSATGTTRQGSFTITNAGNSNLTNLAVTQDSTLNDSDNSIITLSITSDISLQTLTSGQTATIYINASVPKSQQRKAYTANLLINSTQAIGAVLAYQITIQESYCELGNKGSYFTIDIKEPDEGDDFYPNDEIPVMLRVKNDDDDDRDMVIVADLYDETDDAFLDVEYETDATLDSDSSDDFEFTLKVPLDVSNTHDYRIYAKVFEDGEEDTQCKEDYISVDVKKETHSLLIDKVDMASTARCDDSITAEIKLANAGKTDEEDIKIEMINSELGISEEKLVDLDAGESRTTELSIKIPKNTTEKDYSMTIRAYYYLSNDEYRKDIQAVKTLKVTGNCMPVIENTVVNAEVLNTAVIKEQFGIKLTVFNTGTSTATYNVLASGYETWATLDKIEPSSITVEAGKSEAAYIYLTPFEDAAGQKSVTVKAMWGSKKVEKTILIPVTDKLTAQSAYQKLSQRLSNLSGFDLATVNIVLVIAIVLVFIWIMRARKAY